MIQPSCNSDSNLVPQQVSKSNQAVPFAQHINIYYVLKATSAKLEDVCKRQWIPPLRQGIQPWDLGAILSRRSFSFCRVQLQFLTPHKWDSVQSHWILTSVIPIECKAVVSMSFEIRSSKRQQRCLLYQEASIVHSSHFGGDKMFGLTAPSFWDWPERLK